MLIRPAAATIPLFPIPTGVARPSPLCGLCGHFRLPGPAPAAAHVSKSKGEEALSAKRQQGAQGAGVYNSQCTASELGIGLKSNSYTGKKAKSGASRSLPVSLPRSASSSSNIKYQISSLMMASRMSLMRSFMY